MFNIFKFMVIICLLSLLLIAYSHFHESYNWQALNLSGCMIGARVMKRVIDKNERRNDANIVSDKNELELITLFNSLILLLSS